MDKTVEKNVISKYDSLFPAEKKVADYILSNINEVINLNVSELAQRSNTSDATVIRTVKHLGYSGYYQMRILLSKDVGKSELLDVNDNTLTAVQKFFSLEAERINLLAESIILSQLIEIANVLLASRFIHIIAVGNTTPITADLGFRLERHGLSCTYSQLYEQFINHITLGTSDDTVIAFSRSGASKQVIRAVELAVKKSMKIIIITGSLNEALVKDADYVIKVNEMNNLFSSIYKPDSHLLEYAINDALIYVIQNIQKVSNIPDEDLEDRDTIGILLSEFKQ